MRLGLFAELTLDRIRRERAIANPGEQLDLADDTIWGPFKNQTGRCIVLSREFPEARPLHSWTPAKRIRKQPFYMDP